MDNNNNNESREHYRKRMEERIQREVNERKRREREEAHNKRENRLRREEEQSSPDYQPPKKHHYRTPNWVRALIGLLICLVVAGGFYEYHKVHEFFHPFSASALPTGIDNPVPSNPLLPEVYPT